MIQFISSLQTLPLRSSQLRNGAPLDQCVFSEDHAAQTFHMGCFLGEESQPIVVLTMQKEDLEGLQGHGYRLRGMATSPPYIGQGYGKLLLRSALGWINEQMLADYVWCQAREVAYGFYENLGFQSLYEPFLIPEIGIHQIMVLKHLDEYTLKQSLYSQLKATQQ
jgi:GNAT superfamily N-acetyltransferase